MTNEYESQVNGEDPCPSTWREVVALSTAGLALLAFFVLLFYLLSQVQELSDIAWTRAVYLLTGVEAIVFAAMGFVFGREVQRGRAEKAEERADVQADRADANLHAAMQGRVLAETVLAIEPTSTDHSRLQGLEGRVPLKEDLEPQLEVARGMARRLLARPERRAGGWS